ncbi:Myosin heavy chain-related protein [Striga hermonthica]|uniref:Myosin heavy chain-related protein n=1 Tax=Striga hermonthica TaxID=68872 RepID=A0A9N7RPN0_STRHE|nr:Myosin heavy chain-related protein [Striga hermonthica]
MFKHARWWSERNKIKVDFKLQFHASQVTQVGGDGLMVSVIPAESGKPTAKSDKATIRDGSCCWAKPVYETVKFNRDPKTGKIHERLYYFVVGTGLLKSGAVGEASVDLSDYAEATRVSTVSLPLQNSKSEAMLHVSIQRIHESMDEREIEERENVKLDSVEHASSLQLGDLDTTKTSTTDSTDDIPFNKTFYPPDSNTKHRVSSESDDTLSSSESSTGLETHWELHMNNADKTHQKLKSGSHTPIYKDHRTSWDWLGNPKDDVLINPEGGTFLEQEETEEAPDILIQKLKANVSALARQAAMSELELQALRKQVVKESKRGLDLSQEIAFLREERDSLQGECERLKASFHRQTNSGRSDSQAAVIEELRQELNHTKELNANLQIQLQKTQESNAELILAVQDLDQMLEQQNRDSGPTHQSDGDGDDDEQKALEDLVKEHGNDSKDAYLVDQQITDLLTEFEIYKRDKDELEVQMEQLALDYEIMKQANHELSSRLEQTQIQEQLKMQYEPLSPETDTISELEFHIETLENELKRLSKDYTDSFAKISSLEAHSRSLEDELEKQARGFKEDLEGLTWARVEQEQRAVKAEEDLKKMRWKNANTAERLQEEFRRLSVQMASTFEANEKLVTKAMTETKEIRFAKGRLEEMLKKAREEHEVIQVGYEARMSPMADEIERMRLDIEEKAGELENQKCSAEDSRRVLSEEILVLRDEIEAHFAKNKILMEEIESKKSLVHEVELMRVSVKEKELLVEQANDERTELENRLEELNKELDKMRCLLREKESVAANMKIELDVIRAQCEEMKDSQLQDVADKEKLKKQVVQLKSDIKKREGAVISMEKKIKDGGGRGMNHGVVKANSKTSKPMARTSKEIMGLKERIKLLEGQIKSKETDLQNSAITFLHKEKDLHNRIEELEERLKLYQSTGHDVEKGYGDKIPNITSMISNEKSNDSAKTAAHIEELNNQMALLKENNKSMEEDLKEMQERYLDISLKFAEVEGERQQLIMKLRNVTYGNK